MVKSNQQVENSDKDNNASDSEAFRIEELKQRYGFFKVVAGTLFLGVVTATLPFIIEYSRVSLDTETSRRDFVTKFVDMLEKEPRSQVALVEYFSYVLPDHDQRKLWVDYRDHLRLVQATRDETEIEIERLIQENDANNSAKVRELENKLTLLMQQLRPVVPIKTPSQCENTFLYKRLSNEYEEIFVNLIPNSETLPIVENHVARIEANRSRYEAIEAATSVPWFFIAVVHSLESSYNFATHLHNGDPLASRTVRVPAGRPRHGSPPYTWEESAIDALKEMHDLEDWSLARTLWRLERYNGFGYRRRGVCSPYLWAFSNHYQSGLYLDGGVFDSAAVAKKVGSAVLLKALVDRGTVTLTRN